MAKKPLYDINKDNNGEVQMDIERLTRSIDVIKHAVKTNISEPDVVHAVGKSLMQHVYDLCEIILHFICRKKAEPNSLADWSRIKDLTKCGGCVDAPVDVCIAASAMKDIKKECDKSFAEPDELKAFFYAVWVFINWAKEELKYSEEASAVFYLIDLIGGWYGNFEVRNRPYTEGHRLYSIYLEGLDEDDLTDEEFDEIYKQRKGNKRESMAALYIYYVLKNHHTDKNNRFHTKDVQKYLWDDYEIKLGRGAIERALISLEAAGDTNIWRGKEKGSGYWYSEKDENAEE